MRAMVLLMVVAGCGGKAASPVELDLTVDAPSAASATVDGTVNVAPAGGTYARAFPSRDEARTAAGTLVTTNADGSARASANYAFGSYCDAETDLARQTERFVETPDGAGGVTLSLASIGCERSDGTGVIVTP